MLCCITDHFFSLLVCRIRFISLCCGCHFAFGATERRKNGVSHATFVPVFAARAAAGIRRAMRVTRFEAVQNGRLACKIQRRARAAGCNHG